MEEKRSLRSLTTCFEIERLGEDLPDLPCNKKVKILLKELANMFRYKFEEERAKESMEDWAEAGRKEFLSIRDKRINSSEYNTRRRD